MSQFNNDELQEKRKRLEDLSLPALQTETLMDIFDFDSITLDINRRNGVTKNQHEMIMAHLKEESDAIWLMINMAMAVSVVLAIIFATQGLPTPYLLMGMAVFLLPLAWYGYSHQGGLRKDLQKLRALQIDGIPITRMGTQGDKTYLNIGNQSLPISWEQAKALNEFSLPMMRVYYAEHSKQILSAEVVYDEKLKNEDLDEAEIVEAKRQYEE